MPPEKSATEAQCRAVLALASKLYGTAYREKTTELLGGRKLHTLPFSEVSAIIDKLRAELQQRG